MALNFKVGDKVRIVKRVSNLIQKDEYIGKECVVEKVDPGWPYPYTLSIYGTTVLWKDEELEAVNGLPRAIEYNDIKKGDVVTVSKNCFGIETVSTFKVEAKDNGYGLHTIDGGEVDAYRADIILLEREADPVGTVYSYASVKGTFIEYYIMTERGLIKAKNISDPNAKIETIPVSKLVKLPTEQ